MFGFDGVHGNKTRPRQQLVLGLVYGLDQGTVSMTGFKD